MFRPFKDGSKPGAKRERIHLPHGGRRPLGLVGALDLSTGISPWSWPVPELPASVWQRLPDDDDELEHLAAHFYGGKAEQLLAVPGSQYLIQRIPELAAAESKVLIPLHGYQEHWQAWHCAGHKVVFYKNISELSALLHEDSSIAYAVVINPNNPSAEVADFAQLQAIEATLADRKGLLLIDEAFMDCSPERSYIKKTDFSHCIILRSIGKFFGLAGMRLGFGVMHRKLRKALAAEVQPWGVNGAARHIGKLCLQDTSWQQQQRQGLAAMSQRLTAILSPMLKVNAEHETHQNISSLVSTSYFACMTAPPENIQAFNQYLMGKGVFVRVFPPPQSAAWRESFLAAEDVPMERMRVGLADEAGMIFLSECVDNYLSSNDCSAV